MHPVISLPFLKTGLHSPSPMPIPFTKAHGAKNDFLLTWAVQAPSQSLAEHAIAICDRHTGIGADGWLLVHPADEDAPASIKLFNSDGSLAEISGNGTRCAAAFLVAAGHATPDIPILTGAGLKHLHLLHREDNLFSFEMNMGTPAIENYRGPHDSTILDVGNPQCALIVDNFDLDWRALGSKIEHDFPNRTNVSFVLPIDRHTIDVRFWERGAGETMSSGTGSTGAAAAAVARGLADFPITVRTPAGDLHLQLRDGNIHLVGPAEIVATGEFHPPAC